MWRIGLSKKGEVLVNLQGSRYMYLPDKEGRFILGDTFFVEGGKYAGYDRDSKFAYKIEDADKIEWREIELDDVPLIMGLFNFNRISDYSREQYAQGDSTSDGSLYGYVMQLLSKED